MIATCDDFNSFCGIWAWLGNCVGKSAQKYLAACPRACGVCVPEGTSGTLGIPTYGHKGAYLRVFLDNETISVSNVTTPVGIEDETTPLGMETTPMGTETTSMGTETTTEATAVPSTTMSSQALLETVTTTPTMVCEDTNKDCQKWASKGRCFYKHVQRLCPGACNGTCDQVHPGSKSAHACISGIPA